MSNHLSILVLLFCFETEFFCAAPAVLELTLETSLAFEFTRSTCLQSAAIKGMHHQRQCYPCAGLARSEYCAADTTIYFS